MDKNRVHEHPILDIKRGKTVNIFWQGKPLNAYENETVSSALIANNIHIFGYHKKDHSPKGIFCANGQCSQCMVIIDGVPKKACMEPVKEGMQVYPLSELPHIPDVSIPGKMGNIQTVKKQVLIIGGGPAGLSAANELGQLGIEVLVVDDRQKLGGKLVLQTHRFFGSTEAVYAGTRGIEIAKILENELNKCQSVQVWTNTTAIGVFSDKKIGVLRNGTEYILISPEVVLVATGARERFLSFKGNLLPGILGAGAFQTLVNRDMVLPAKRIFVVGGGNVGLIAAYHALQAGIAVAGLAEVMPKCGGYKVHRDKLVRHGVPIYTSHTVIRANGKHHVESITIAEVDKDRKIKPKTEKTFDVDGVLLAVGLEPVKEIYESAKKYGMQVFAAGDAEEIAEASAAIFSGKIRAIDIANTIRKTSIEIPKEWEQSKAILASKPGDTSEENITNFGAGIYPVFHCTQKIPCDPCAHLCPLGLIQIDKKDIRELPHFIVDKKVCVGCGKCVVGCPGLAITLVDYRNNKDFAIVTLPFEMNDKEIKPGQKVLAIDTTGGIVETCEIIANENLKRNSKTSLVKIKASLDNAEKIAGIRSIEKNGRECAAQRIPGSADDAVVCICEKVTAKDIRDLVREGITDLNAIKAITRAGMGACGGKTCEPLIKRILIEEGIHEEVITPLKKRPLSIEVPIKYFSGIQEEIQDD